MIVIAQAVLLYRLLRELRNAHVNLAAEVGVVRRESHKYTLDLVNKTITLLNLDQNAMFEKSDAYAKSLNERLVLLEIEKPQKPKEAEEPAPSRRSFASQKARAEAGARK